MLNRLIELLRRFLARLGLGSAKGGKTMEPPTERSVTGVFTPPEEDRKRIPPEQGFGKAIKNGVDLIAEGWGTGDFDVTIKLQATVIVENPGEIGQYRAVISEP
jgi:hypothetical protein